MTDNWSIIDFPASDKDTILSRSTKTTLALAIEKFVINKTITDKIKKNFFIKMLFLN